MQLETLAHLMMLTPAQAVALPSVVDNAAGKLGWNRQRIVAECQRNDKLRLYLADACRAATN